MGESVEVDVITNSLPGAWHISATNLPMWLDGSRRDAELEYSLRGEQPLVLDDRVHFTDANGTPRTIAGVASWTGDGFRWRGAGRLRLQHGRWTVGALDGDVLVIHFERSRATPAGTVVAVRAGTRHPELRRLIAADPQRFGLSLEQFASLTWLDHVPAV